MNTPAEKRAILLNATADFPATRTVYLQASCLLAALGSLAATLVPGINLAEKVEQEKQALAGEIAKLQSEQARLQEQVRLGFPGARKQLEQCLKFLRQAQSGQLQTPCVVPVLVGPLREALASAQVVTDSGSGVDNPA